MEFLRTRPARKARTRRNSGEQKVNQISLKTSANREPGDRSPERKRKKRRRAREETHHRCPKKEMDATGCGRTILGVERDNYSPHYFLSVSATKVNIVIGDRQR